MCFFCLKSRSNGDEVFFFFNLDQVNLCGLSLSCFALVFRAGFRRVRRG